MTISVLWSDKTLYSNDIQYPCIKCYADSLVSSQNGVLTEHAMKILPLTLSFSMEYQQITGDEPPRPYQLGFTYAGNIEVAMYAYSLLSFFCSNLMPISDRANAKKAFPSILDISCLAGNLLKGYIEDFAVIQGTYASAEIVLFGFCQQSLSNKVFHVYPMVENAGAQYHAQEIDLSGNRFFSIGTGKPLLEEKILGGDERPVSEIIRDLISDKKSIEKGVGGFLQRAWYSNQHLNIYNETPSTDTEMKFLGKFPMCTFLSPSCTHYVSLKSHAVD